MHWSWAFIQLKAEAVEVYILEQVKLTATIARMFQTGDETTNMTNLTALYTWMAAYLKDVSFFFFFFFFFFFVI